MKDQEEAASEQQLRDQLKEEEYTAHAQHLKKLEEKFLSSKKQLKVTSSAELTTSEEIVTLLEDETDFVNATPESSSFNLTLKSLRKSSIKEETPTDIRVALPRFFDHDDPFNSNGTFAKKPVLCFILFNHNGEFEKKGVAYTPGQTCDQFISLSVIPKLVRALGIDLDKSTPQKYVLKAVGSIQYFWGETTLTQYQYVKDQLSKPASASKLEFVFLDTVESLKNCHHPLDPSLKNISYDFLYKREEEKKQLETFDHDKIQEDVESGNEPKLISLWSISKPFQFRLKSCANLDLLSKSVADEGEESSNYHIYALNEILYGGTIISKRKFSKAIPFGPVCMWNEQFSFDVMVSDLPREAVLCVTFFAKICKNETETIINVVEEDDKVVGCVKIPLFDFERKLRSGTISSKLWENEKATPIHVSMENLDGKCPVSIEFEKYNSPVVYPSGKLPSAMIEKFTKYEQMQQKRYNNLMKLPKATIQSKLLKISSYDPLYKLDHEDKFLLWNYRDLITHIPDALPKFLQSIPIKYPYARMIAVEYAEKWEKPSSPINAIEFLDYRFPDIQIRRTAVDTLNRLTDKELNDFILQLVQILKYELYHDSAIVRFLLERATKSCHTIGHVLFWALKAELYLAEVRYRYALILIEYLRTCKNHTKVLLKQFSVVIQLLSVTIDVGKVQKDRTSFLREELKSRIQFPPVFTLPIHHLLEFKNVRPDKCKVMSSKKHPLFLAFENIETPDLFFIMFKAGDDLRQDLLTLQLLNIMDHLWKKEGLDLSVIPYSCICTGYMTGCLEIVTESETIAKIWHESGDTLNAFTKAPLLQWMKKNIKPSITWEATLDNFVRSCAGYCTATYVMGIGDRHSDNLMITKEGKFFHIDFGHILGNFKKFHGIKRETAPFVFTPLFSHVMGGTSSDTYKKFQKLCIDSYVIIRKNANMFINLFMLMIPSGMPELASEADLEWLRSCLVLSKNEKEARDHMKHAIKQAHGDIRTVFNLYLHIKKHYGLK